ncbi:MAG: glycosyltransferase family 2 protein [Bacteroidia bacterium]
MKKLSILIPVYNEEKHIIPLLEKVRGVKLIGELEKEIIVINDCSTDGTEKILQDYIRNHPELEIIYLKHQANQGKGAALHTGIQKATGDYIIIQDADLELDPQEYNLLLQPMVEGFADVVYGSRFTGARVRRVFSIWHALVNKFLTFLLNLFTNLNLTDMEVCYKLFKREILQSIRLEEKRFGFEPEVTAKIARIPNIRIYEVGISYYGRTYGEGKKIGWRDGLRALYCIFKYGLLGR